MEGNQSIDTHEMDLVEEFRALDEMEDPVDDATGRLDAFGGGEHLLALEASIGKEVQHYVLSCMYGSQTPMCFPLASF